MIQLKNISQVSSKCIHGFAWQLNLHVDVIFLRHLEVRSPAFPPIFTPSRGEHVTKNQSNFFETILKAPKVNTQHEVSALQKTDTYPTKPEKEHLKSALVRYLSSQGTS